MFSSHRQYLLRERVLQVAAPDAAENTRFKFNVSPAAVQVTQTVRPCEVVVNRVAQIVLVSSTLLGSWLGMQLLHESGHIVAAPLTGGRVSRVVLDPTTISRTDLSSNPRPLVVVWAGPIVGATVPLVLWGVAISLRLSAAFLMRFFAGFCLIANGLYISFGSINGVGDCGEMLRYGSMPWHLWLFGAVTVPVGLWLWHGQGSHFGFGENGCTINSRIAIGCLATSVALLVLGLVVGGK